MDKDTKKNFDWKAKDFDYLANKAVELWKLLARLNGGISGNFKIENNFVFDADGGLSSAKKCMNNHLVG